MVTISQKARDVYINRPTVGLWILYGIYPKKGTLFYLFFIFLEHSLFKTIEKASPLSD